MGGYYEDRLAGERLRECYDLATPGIRRYLEAEIAFVSVSVRGAGRTLELGCGYGRVLREVSTAVTQIVGCDISRTSLKLADAYLEGVTNCNLVRSDATRLPFRSGAFDAVLCIQNGISAFAVDRRRLVEEAVRVTRPGGSLLFSSYSPRIWEDRLEWFRLQARAGLLGEIDEAETGNGTIVCKDGFRATTVDGEEFRRLFVERDMRVSIQEVDGSSLFCIATKGR